MGLILCVAAFTASWYYGRRSLSAGMAVVLTAGYLFGITRANYLDSFTFFLYDAAVVGLYIARFSLPNALSPPYAKGLTGWAMVLAGWPFVMVIMCSLFPQHPLIQLVGLRAAIWYLPFLLLGASARAEDLTMVARTLAALNVVTLLFAGGEFFLGVERFYPKNEVTNLIYRCNDVGTSMSLRIPGTFSTAASYGSIMVATIPWLVGRWQMPKLPSLERWMFGIALLAATLGTFLCGSRSPVVLLLALGAFLVYQFRTKLGYLALAVGIAGIVGYVVSGSERLQRFTTLKDTNYVERRIQTSVHMGFFDLMTEYPIGAGLGSAFGTSIPSFLKHLQDKPQIGMENEYARIGLEQGLLGIALWVAFLIWFLTRRRVDASPGLKIGYKLMYVHTLFCWGNAFIGTGLMTAIPATMLLMFQMGVLARERGFAAPMVRPPIRPGAGSPHERNGALSMPEKENRPCLSPG